MSFNDCKISESQIQTTGVQSQPDTLTGSAADNKKVFDALPTLVIQKLNSLIDQMQQQAAAGQIGVTPFAGMTAQTLQAALEQIQADIGGNYGGADGADKVGYTPSEGVEEDTVQAAIEAVQANLTAYIAKIKAATGAAEVGNAPIAGMTATNVQQALEELRKNIDNIVSGIIPGGSITSEMLQDGAVTEAKLSSDVAAKLAVLGGATTPQAALAALGAGVRPNLLINPLFQINQRGETTYGESPQYTVDCWKISSDYAYVDVIDDGIKIRGNDINGYGGIEQKLDDNIKASLNGKTLTFTILARAYIPFKLSGAEINSINPNQYQVYSRTFLYSDGFGVLITALSSAGLGENIIDIKASKLEEGSTQTLAYQDSEGAWQLLPQPESDYATQLAKCQRYLLPIGMGSVLENIRVSRITSSRMDFFVPTPAQMRVAPTLSGDAQIITMSNSAQTGFAFSTQLLCNGINVVAAKDGHGLSDARLNLQNCFLSAEF